MTTADAEQARNPFWTTVCGRPPVTTGLLEIRARDLAAATREAFRHAGSSYAFRRPRELVDLTGRFRHFTYAGVPFVGKRGSSVRAATREADNAWQAAARLEGVERLDPVVPVTADDGLLAAPDHGPSLSHAPEKISRILPWEDLLTVMADLAAVGIEWPGFLPRNVLATGSRHLRLIDWESCRFEPSGAPCRTIGDLTLLFWAIAWAGCYGLDTATFEREVCKQLGLRRRMDPLDRFERTYASIMGADGDQPHVRDRCTAATVATESADLGIINDDPLTTGREVSLTAAEIGHLMNELLPPNLSVLYTFAALHHIEEQGLRRYQTFVDAMTRALVLGTPCEGLEGDPAGQRRLQLLLISCMAGVVLDGASAHELVETSTATDFLDLLQEASPSVRELTRAAGTDRRVTIGDERVEGVVDRIVTAAAEAGRSAARLPAGHVNGEQLQGTEAIRAELLDIATSAQVR